MKFVAGERAQSRRAPGPEIGPIERDTLACATFCTRLGELGELGELGDRGDRGGARLATGRSC